jgi:hypothetical protein
MTKWHFRKLSTRPASSPQKKNDPLVITDKTIRFVRHTENTLLTSSTYNGTHEVLDVGAHAVGSTRSLGVG